jgi:hypothetical protein
MRHQRFRTARLTCSKKTSELSGRLPPSFNRSSAPHLVFKGLAVPADFNNLFGVDIMEEAVEICKLRLFLKLVAQVESQDRIEPLPDIDFNIRAGNTLVGYATLKDIGPTRGIRTDEENEMLGAIEDKAHLLGAKVGSFRLQQTELDGTVTPDGKANLRIKFDELDRELNEYLSGEYGVKKSDARKWTSSHKPFHWFCGFYEIVSAGGFDVIIGNPPYVVFPSEKVTYGFPPGSFTIREEPVSLDMGANPCTSRTIRPCGAYRAAIRVFWSGACTSKELNTGPAALYPSANSLEPNERRKLNPNRSFSWSRPLIFVKRGHSFSPVWIGRFKLFRAIARVLTYQRKVLSAW